MDQLLALFFFKILRLEGKACKKAGIKSRFSGIWCKVFKVMQDFYADKNIEEKKVRLDFAEFLASKHLLFNLKLQA